MRIWYSEKLFKVFWQFKVKNDNLNSQYFGKISVFKLLHHIRDEKTKQGTFLKSPLRHEFIITTYFFKFRIMEYIVLEPLQCEKQTQNVSIVERKFEITPEEQKLLIHEAEGPFTGFIVKKAIPIHLPKKIQNMNKFDLSFKLKILMKHATLPQVQQEKRELKFWFMTKDEKERIKMANMFFKNLFKGDDFPKDYFLFLLRIMQIVKALKPIARIKIEIEKIGEPQPLGSQFGQKDPKQFEAIISGKILEFLERAFPNTMSIEDLANLTESDPDLAYKLLCDLLDRDLVKYYDNGANWIRNYKNIQDKHEVYLVEQQPALDESEQPTIAIITVNYYEKLAVDAMMTDKITFVRLKPEGLGESTVYTIGRIGDRIVVSTKLPLLNKDSRSAKISSGNTTTRLLGTFNQIEHVFLVGCAGAIPNLSDFNKHLRRGDIVVSFPDSNPDTEDYIYGHFEIQKNQNNSNSQYVSKLWMPKSMELYRIVLGMLKAYDPQSERLYPWEEYLNEGIESLYNEELDCKRPSEDKLFFTIGDKNLVEVDHPVDTTGSFNRREYGFPVVKFGKIASVETLVKNEAIRSAISEENDILCFDSGMDQVMESIEGNRKESYIIIRSIADYADGCSTKEWQPYSALCAAAFAKTIITALPAVSYDQV
ncbi:unnamed protein product [Brachionus calyciflorus]|uniref:Winged helix-turn-helix domain-containing protein n=1 Tax=Brachionus calyciflorus TaxID=104777 RepID=A0A813NSS5_9BILA|nr:unnamed protein product [Brachionus calyciflorus]